MKRIILVAMLVWQAHSMEAVQKNDNVALVVLWIGATGEINAGSYIQRERSTDKQNLAVLANEIGADTTIWVEISGKDLNPNFAKQTFNRLASARFGKQMRAYDKVVLITMTHIHGIGFIEQPSHAPWILFNPFDNFSYNQDDLLSSEEIYDKMRNSGNFDHVIVVNESCNNIGGKTPPATTLDLPIMKGSSNKLSDLIFSEQAIFLASCEYGQYSEVTKFSNVFWEVLNEVSVGRIRNSWEGRNGLFEHVSKRTSLETGGKQVPIGFVGDILSPGVKKSSRQGPFKLDKFILENLPENNVVFPDQIDPVSGAKFRIDD